ncbi:MAG: hypothetical protein KF862_13175 [Chitinophagaceae bacterium]|nr:hypothetical protein [Chitinophagaceae bacterium]
MASLEKDKKKSPSKSRDNAAFVNNTQEDSSKTKSNLLQIPSVSLPKGGGAIKSIDEKFSVNAANGTAAYSIPLPFSAGRAGTTPNLSLSYNSGAGNSEFGLGWSVDIPCIQRKSDKKLPEYKESIDSDIFLLSGAEDLVHYLEQEANGNWKKKEIIKGNKIITRYRPRIEGGFTRIEKIVEDGNIYWQSRTKDNIVSVFGKSIESKLFSPVTGEENKIVKWRLEYSYDDKGNISRYFYKKEDKANVNFSLSEKNRLQDLAPFTNSYLKRIQYGNKTAFYESGDLPSDFMFELVLDYGEHDIEKPKPTPEVVDNEEKAWLLRKDPFSDYRSGFEIRTYRLCRRMLMFHHFADELGIVDYMVRSLDLGHDEQPHLTYLETVTQTGYIWNKDGSLKSKKSLPPLSFSYIKPGFSKEVKEISPDNIVNAPVGIDDLYQWTDLYSEGISGILTEQATGWFYKENQGNGQFSAPRLISPRPSMTGLENGTLSLQDLEANGKKYLVSTTGAVKGYFELTPEEEWISFFPFTNYPNIDLKDPNLKFLDLNGDGMADLLFSTEQNFIWYAAKGKAGYDDYNIATKTMDEEKGPAIVFADKNENMLIAIADMSGDGLADIVLITYNTVSYYPNLGYGRFGAKVNMEVPGVFDSFTAFNTAQIHFTDVDGSGTTDIVYTGNGEIQVWFNQSGNNFSQPSRFFNPFPHIDKQTRISFIDLLGNGTSCIAWSSSLPQYSNAPLRYIDMMEGKKPHVMHVMKNNMGKEVTLEYKSSTQYYLQDKQSENKWVTKLPFPVQCVSKVTVIDKVSQTRFINEYTYHHGYYDSMEREFRGFAMVEQKDTEEYDHFVKETSAANAANTIEKDLFQPAVITKSWFHTGAFINRNTFFHALQKEYYPGRLFAGGKITDARIINALSDYSLQEEPFEDNLSTVELIECCRALKGLPLRQEIYSDEGTEEQKIHPYSVTQNNYTIRRLQPKEENNHAVFISHEKEKLIFQYERNPMDPRIAHTINIETDEYGNVKQSASIAYGRKKDDDLLPTDADRQKQKKQYITYTTNLFTRIINEENAYRLPVGYDTQTWELNLSSPGTGFFTAKQIETAFNSAGLRNYEEEIRQDQKRKIEHLATRFLKNDLSGPMPAGFIDTLALPYQNYLLAFTPTLVNTIYRGNVADGVLLNDAIYISLDNDGNYWIASGRTYYHPDLLDNPFVKNITLPTPADVAFAKENFYLPIAYEDNFGNLTKCFYDTYKLLINHIIDPVDNEIKVLAVNYRALLPYLLSDVNENRSGVRFDELGLVTHTFVMGKAGEFAGDFLDTASLELSDKDDPTSSLAYDLMYFSSGGILPNRTRSLVREQHHFVQTEDNHEEVANNIRWQESYSYSDGSGHEVLKKVQAEPGDAPQRDQANKLVKDPGGNIIFRNTSPLLRWVGNGRTIYNNKGNPVKQYEPYFDSSSEYNTENELCEFGFSSLIFYDAPGRVVKTKHPNGTFSKTEFNAWMQKTYDQNDTVLEAECSWYTDRINGEKGMVEKETAQKTAVHAGTPGLTYLDSLARPFLSVAHNKIQRSNENVLEDFCYVRTYLDIEGNSRKITNIKNSIEQEVMTWQYDMLGNICHQHSADAGDRLIFQDAVGKPIRLWDSRSNVFSYAYDALHRPLQLTVENGSTKNIFEKYEYGDTMADVDNAKKNNLRGKLYRHFDTAGIVTNEAFDFKGNLLHSSRKLLRDYKKMPDWNQNQITEDETFGSETKYDALNRPVQTISPDRSLLFPSYNEAGLLNSVSVKIKGSNTLTVFITNIDYNAKGQRQKIEYQNGTSTFYTYDPKNYRLIRLQTIRNNDNTSLQDLNYTYDPAGNITSQFDNAQKTVFYGGQKVEAKSNYRYDALYRLIEADGREHIGQVSIVKADNRNDNWCRIPVQPNSPVQLRAYTQKYFYDEAGNITTMRHIADAGNWTRTYQYNPDNNQLLRTTMSNDAPVSQDFDYTYNTHGSIEKMPHLLQKIGWNFREEMQHIHLGGGGEAWYVYDASGQRTRKVIEKDQQREERIYIGSFEVFRLFDNASNKALERETLHIMDDRQRIAMVETRTAGDDGSAPQLIRYQYNNHLGSACLELDENAKIISYEEYHPYGTTAYQATDASRQVPAKRYRYTGMERDEESGFNYHSARYYIPWLGRWLSADPIGIGDGLNIYCYGKCNPKILTDRNGMGCNYHDDKGNMYDICIEDGQKFPEPTKPKPPPSKKTDGASNKAVVNNESLKNADTESTGEKVVDVVTDFIPIVGGVKDIYKGVKEGKGWKVALGVGSIAFDVFTLGGGSLIKGGLKTSIKQGAKIAVKEGVETVGKEAAELAVKELAEKAAKETAEKAAKEAAEKAAKEAAEKAAKEAAGKVALDANALIRGLEKGELAALDAAIAGRVPTISITAAKEFLKKGDVAILRKFLADRSGSIGKAATEEQIKALQAEATLIGRVLRAKDAAVVGSAVNESAVLITRDEKLFKFLKAVGIAVSKF